MSHLLDRDQRLAQAIGCVVAFLPVPAAAHPQPAAPPHATLVMGGFIALALAFAFIALLGLWSAARRRPGYQPAPGPRPAPPGLHPDQRAFAAARMTGAPRPDSVPGPGSAGFDPGAPGAFEARQRAFAEHRRPPASDLPKE